MGPKGPTVAAEGCSPTQELEKAIFLVIFKFKVVQGIYSDKIKLPSEGNFWQPCWDDVIWHDYNQADYLIVTKALLVLYLDTRSRSKIISKQ